MKKKTILNLCLVTSAMFLFSLQAREHEGSGRGSHGDHQGSRGHQSSSDNRTDSDQSGRKTWKGQTIILPPTDQNQGDGDHREHKGWQGKTITIPSDEHQGDSERKTWKGKTITIPSEEHKGDSGRKTWKGKTITIPTDEHKGEGERKTWKGQKKWYDFQGHDKVSKKEIRKHFHGKHFKKYDKGLIDVKRRDYRKTLEGHKKRAFQVRKHMWKKHRDRDIWFTEPFFVRHRYRPDFDVGLSWWRPVRWSQINLWLGWGWGVPFYYDEGGYVIEVEREPQGVAIDVPGDWMPLGVFALARDESQAESSDIFIQLALNRSGEVAGTHYNALTDKTDPIEGEIDRESQEVGWRLSDNEQAPFMTTGLYNLTQDVAPVVLHYLGGRKETWVLIRMEE